MPVPAWRGSARLVCRRYIAQPDAGSHRKSATGSRAKRFRATTRRNRKASGRRSRPVAKRGGLEHKNKTETISADVRSDLELRRPIADGREWNRAFRYRSKDRQARLGRSANAQA